MNEKWEYCSTTFKHSKEAMGAVMHDFCEIGKQGWELVSVTSMQTGAGNAVVWTQCAFFKRRLSSIEKLQ